VPSKNLRTLNNGWPLGEGPLERYVRFEIRLAIDLADPDGLPVRRVYMVCGYDCPTAIHEMTADDGGAWTWTLRQLAARVADHTLKCHAEDIADLTYT
jgi:hypothetical protein